MRLVPRSEKAIAWTISGVFAALAVVLAGLVLVTGGLDDGDQLGTTQGFEARQAPRDDLGSDRWPEDGYNEERTRANPALQLPQWRQRLPRPW